MFRSIPSIVNRATCLRLTAARMLSRAVAATLLPPRCCLCGFPGESLDLDICRFCRESLPWDRRTAVGKVAAFRYEFPVDDLIRDMKYRGAVSSARVLGALLAMRVRARGEPLPRLLIPVPLHEARLRDRGFNQALALARWTGRLLDIPCAASLVSRTRATPSQTGLSRAGRRRNVRGAFAISPGRRQRMLLAAGHVALIDDVITTGNTVAELQRVLQRSGVRRVDVWTAAQVSSAAA